METSILPQVPALLDLSRVDADRRAGLWVSTATTCFPGLSVSDMPAEVPIGQIQSIPMGGGSLWSILSAPAQVSYSPTGGGDDAASSISLLLQLDGAIVVGQNHRACELGPGDMCLVDERFGFHLQGEVCSHIVFLRMPRRAVLGRHPHLEHCTARGLDAEDPGAQLLRDTLTRAVQAAPDLREEQRGSVLAAMVHLLGAATAPRGDPPGEAPWRVRAALAFIETHLGDADLTAERVAEAGLDMIVTAPPPHGDEVTAIRRLVEEMSEAQTAIAGAVEEHTSVTAELSATIAEVAGSAQEVAGCLDTVSGAAQEKVAQ